MQLVGITGFKETGKGVTATLLRENHEGIVYEVGFSDKLKILAARTLGYDDRDPRKLIALMDEFKIEGNMEFGSRFPWMTLTGRQYLQNLGYQARLLFGEDFWVDQVLPRPSIHPSIDNRQVENALMLSDRFPTIDCVAITDLRFPNEAVRVKALGGVIWQVIRPGAESDGHDSEQPLPPELVDWQIHNDGDLDDLSDSVYEAIVETL